MRTCAPIVMCSVAIFDLSLSEEHHLSLYFFFSLGTSSMECVFSEVPITILRLGLKLFLQLYD